MELLSNLAIVLQTAATLANLAYCLFGVILGTAVGVLPGLGAIARRGDASARHLGLAAGIIADHARRHLLRRAVRRLDARRSLSICRVRHCPVVTALDGYQMARKGQAGESHSPLRRSARSLPAFGPAEYFSLMVLGLAASVVLAHGSVRAPSPMTLFGLCLAGASPRRISQGQRDARSRGRSGWAHNVVITTA